MQRSTTDVQEIAVATLGDYSRALYGPSPTGDEVTLLVQDGSDLIRLSVVSPSIDPTQAAVGIVQAMIA